MIHKLNNFKNQFKNSFKYRKYIFNPYLYANRSVILNNNRYKSLNLSLLYFLPKNKLIISKIYNITSKKNLRMGKGKGKIIDSGIICKSLQPLWISNKLNTIQCLYIKYILNKLIKKYNYLSFK